jgi:hypothetical protein
MPSEVMEDEPKFARCASCSQRIRWQGYPDFEEVVVDGIIHREGTLGRATLCEEP